MEAGFHLGTMRKRPEVGCVLHFQSPYATVVACMKDKPADFNVTVVEALTAHDIVLMSNHGQVACGPDFPDTFRRAVFFEMACRIIVLSRGNYTTV